MAVLEKKKTISTKHKKCATKYLAQLINDELVEHAEQNEANVANISEDRDQALISLISMCRQMDTKRRFKELSEAAEKLPLRMPWLCWKTLERTTRMTWRETECLAL